MMYPRDINGSVRVNVIRGIIKFLLCNRLIDIVFEKNNVIVIKAIFNIVIINKELDITVLGRLPELISLLIAS